MTRSSLEDGSDECPVGNRSALMLLRLGELKVLCIQSPLQLPHMSCSQSQELLANQALNAQFRLHVAMLGS